MRWPIASWWYLERSTAHEFLDAPDIQEQELRANLDDLRSCNRTLGSRWIVLRALHHLWRQAGQPATWRILDVGTGAGDIPLALGQWGQRRGVRLRVVGLDMHQGVIDYLRLRRQTPAEFELVRADALHLPFRPGTFDVALCSSMLHHLTWEQGVLLLQMLTTVCRYGFIVNDLLRSRSHYIGARLLLPLLTHSRITRHDGVLSVRRAYRLEEVREMAETAGVRGVQVRLVLGYRLLLTCTLPEQ